MKFVVESQGNLKAASCLGFRKYLRSGLPAFPTVIGLYLRVKKCGGIINDGPPVQKIQGKKLAGHDKGQFMMVRYGEGLGRKFG